MKVYKGPAYAFRNEVLLAFHAAGFTGARTWIDEHGYATGEHHTGDVLGLPFTVATRNQKTIKLSDALREAEEEAAGAGHFIFASVQSRHGYPVGGSYATTTLDGLLRLARLAYPDAVASPKPRDHSAPYSATNREPG